MMIRNNSLLKALVEYTIPAKLQTIDTASGYDPKTRSKGAVSNNILIQVCNNLGLNVKEIDKQYYNKDNSRTLYDYVDRVMHVDYLITNQNNELIAAVDVKTFYYPGAHYQVEIKNVNGDDGWIEGGATHIVYINQFEKELTIIPLEGLQHFYYKQIPNIDLRGATMKNIYPNDILTTTYSRSGERDEVYFISKRNVMAIPGTIIYNYKDINI